MQWFRVLIESQPNNNSNPNFCLHRSLVNMADVEPPVPPTSQELSNSTPEMPSSAVATPVEGQDSTTETAASPGSHRVTYDSGAPATATSAIDAAVNNGGSGGGGGVPAPVAPVQRCELEEFKRCSESHLWKLMMSFYDRKGIESWSQGVVPHFITCNAFIGKAYAKVLQGFIRDAVCGGRVALDSSQPLYIIELGTGSGKFSYYMLKALEEMSATLDFPISKVVYVMTDFTDENVKFWRNHPQLKTYFDRGMMDSAIFDAVNDTSITLTERKVTLSAGSVKNPLCVVANYLFDTLCHDIFQVTPPPLVAAAASTAAAAASAASSSTTTDHGTGDKDTATVEAAAVSSTTEGILKEGLISVGSKRAEEPDPLDPEIIKRLDNRFRYDPIGDDYYDGKEDPKDAKHFRRMFAWYRDYFGGGPAAAAGAGGVGASGDRSGASLLLPIGAIRALRHLTAFAAGGKCLVVSGDKGNNNPEQFRGLMDPHIAVHGSFSVMVNYHAIGAYFTSRGGFALHNPQEEASLKVSAFVLPGAEPPSADSEAAATAGGGNGVAAAKAAAGEEEEEEGAAAEAADALAGITGWKGDSLDLRDERRKARFPHLAAAFESEVEAFGPNDFFVMQKALKEDAPQPTLKAVVALLKLADWDPDVFYKFRDVILNQVPTYGHKLRNDLCRGVPRVWLNHYTLDKEKDVAFEIGRFYYGIRDYAHALEFYTTSSETVGKHHVTSHNMGLCFYSMSQFPQALEKFNESIGLNKNYEKAAIWRDKVLQELDPNNTAAKLEAEREREEKERQLQQTLAADNESSDGE